MNVFVISFRIHDDSTYEARYNSVVAAIKSAAAPGTYWDETTSFFIISSTKNSAQVADSIDQNSLLIAAQDMLLIVNLSQKGYKIIGKYDDKDIDKLMTLR